MIGIWALAKNSELGACSVFEFLSWGGSSMLGTLLPPSLCLGSGVDARGQHWPGFSHL